MSESIGKELGKIFAKKSLVAAGLALGVGTLLEGSLSVDGVMDNILPVFMPALLGADVANALEPAVPGEKLASTVTILRAAVAGAASAGVLMAVGAIPSGISGPGMTIALLSAASVTVADQFLV
jgi:hypothetical protein